MNISYSNDGGCYVLNTSEGKWINGSLKVTVSIFAIFLELAQFSSTKRAFALKIIEMNALTDR